MGFVQTKKNKPVEIQVVSQVENVHGFYLDPWKQFENQKIFEIKDDMIFFEFEMK